jgi:hypothetical protein
MIIAPNIQLLSFHIFKTAGTSFRNTLCDVYGNESVIRFDIPTLTKKITINETPINDYNLPLAPSIRVLHGHFSYHDLRTFVHYPSQQTKKITWLRHPVERVISHYYYLHERFRAFLPVHQHKLLVPLQRSLLEYAQQPVNRNVMTHFLDGLTLQQLDFVGITEHYQTDLTRLAQTLGWNTDGWEAYHHNATETKQNPNHRLVNDDTWAQIAELNQLDLELYHQALTIRQQALSPTLPKN